MSNTNNLDEKMNNIIKIKEEGLEIPNEDNKMNQNINFPKVLGSNSNDISKLNSSFISSKNLDLASKANSDPKNFKNKKCLDNSKILNFEDEIEYIFQLGKEDEKRESNFFSEKALYDEINIVDKESSKNDNDLSKISNILNCKNKKYLEYIIDNKIISRSKNSRNSELYNISKSEHSDYYTKKENASSHSINITKNNQIENSLSDKKLNKANKEYNNVSILNTKHNEIIINLDYEKDVISKKNQGDIESRLNKINEKLNSIIKISTNPSTLETQLASKITDNTSMYKNNSLDEKIEKSNKSSCFKSLCFTGTEKKKK